MGIHGGGAQEKVTKARKSIKSPWGDASGKVTKARKAQAESQRKSKIRAHRKTTIRVCTTKILPCITNILTNKYYKYYKSRNIINTKSTPPG